MFGLANYIATVVLVTFICFKFSTSHIIPRYTREVKVDPDSPGLYDGFTKATVLNGTNFKQEIFNNQKLKFWIVEFYNHWCGYCMRFVPVLKAFASDIYEWRDFVGIGTINCANIINNDICRNSEIKTVPSLKIFPPNSDEKFMGQAFGHHSQTTISEMRENLAQNLKLYHNSQDKINSSVNLKLLTQSNLGLLWKEIPPTVTYLLLVFEPKDSLIGSQVALDISRTPVIRVRLVDPKNKNLIQLVNMDKCKICAIILERTNISSINDQAKSYSKIININDELKINLNTHVSIIRKLYFSASGNDIHEPSYNESTNKFYFQNDNFNRESLNKAVRAYLINRGVKIAPELYTSKIIYANISIDDIKKAGGREKKLKDLLRIKYLSSVIFQVDLEAAISYVFMKEVTLKRVISGEQLNALKTFMTIIIKYFPTRKRGKRFFKNLKKRELDNKDTINGDDLRRAFEELEQKYKPFMPNLEWVGCRGTIASLRGYPCGLWTMFHTLVGLEELSDRKSNEEKPEVLNAIVGYTKHFFSCSQCAEHFTQMSKTIAGNVTSQREAVMWLWRAHNNVNRRLAGDETEDPRHHKVQFPTKDECPACRTSDGSWDESQVFLFIRSMVTNINLYNPALTLTNTNTN